jgi:hypothetical protein
VEAYSKPPVDDILEEVIEEVRIPVLIAGLSYILLGHEVVVRMIALPSLLLPLFSDARFLFVL